MFIQEWCNTTGFIGYIKQEHSHPTLIYDDTAFDLNSTKYMD